MRSRKQTPIPNPKEIYQLAVRYSEASTILGGQANGGGWGASAPQLLVDSLAIELYLKCLYVLDTGLAPPRTHDWVKLFEALGSPTRAIIREKFDRIVKEDPVLRNLHVINPDALKVTDFDRSLQVARHTFDKRRYLFETNSNDEWFYAHLLHQAIRSVAAMDIRLAGVSIDTRAPDL